MIEAHRTYVKKVTALADAEGKALSGSALVYLGKLLKASNGRPDVFMKLVHQAKGAVSGRLKKNGYQALQKAAAIGSGFRKEKQAK